MSVYYKLSVKRLYWTPNASIKLVCQVMYLIFEFAHGQEKYSALKIPTHDYTPVQLASLSKTTSLMLQCQLAEIAAHPVN